MKKNNMIKAGVAIASVAIVGSLQAQTIGFEGMNTGVPGSPWSTFDNPNTIVDLGNGAASGTQVMRGLASNNNGTDSYISLTSLTLGQTYTVTFSAAGVGIDDGNPGTVDTGAKSLVFAISNSDLTLFSAGFGGVVGNGYSGLSLLTSELIDSGNSIAPTWTDYSFQFVANSDTDLLVIAGDQKAGAVGEAEGFYVDNIRFNAVPEPSSTCLLGIGALSFLLRRKK